MRLLGRFGAGVVLMVGIAGTAVPAEGPMAQASPCALSAVQDLASRTTAGLRSRRVDIDVGSAERAEATAYGPDADPAVIVVAIYGETGRVELLFSFGRAVAFVRHTAYQYASPLRPGGEIGFTVTTEFAMCDGQSAASRSGGEVTAAYRQATEILAVVRARLSGR